MVKDATHEEMLAAIRAVEHGSVLLGPGVSARGAASLFGAEAPDDHFGLTQRELDVLDLLAKGPTSPMIAGPLGFSGKTFSNNVSMILTKLGVTDRVEAARMARQRES